MDSRRRWWNGSSWCALATIAAGAIASCGGGNGGGKGASEAPAVAAVDVVQAPLAIGDTRFPYEQRIAAGGGSGPCEFAFDHGSLPPGLTLEADGRIVGTPTANGTFAFWVRATDPRERSNADTCLFSIDVGTFYVDVHYSGGLGEVWVGDTCWFSTPLEPYSVTYELLENRTGATFTPVLVPGDLPQYEAGLVPGTDVVRCTRETGAYIDVGIEVRADPFENMTAQFGTTDVWYVALDEKIDLNGPFATDLDAALARVGLRSTSPDSNLMAERLARLAVVREVLGCLNAMHGHREDASRRPDGLPISTPYARPDASHTPATGSHPAAPGHYNVIALPVAKAHGISVATRGWQPDQGNATVDSGVIFLDTVVNAFNANYANVILTNKPIGAGDEPILRALLHGLPLPAGPRAAEIYRVLEGFGRLLSVLAEEIIGLDTGLSVAEVHAFGPPIGGGTGQFPTIDFMPMWTPAQMQVLRQALPGPGR